MNKVFGKRSAFFGRADFLSAKDLAQRAVAISVIFLLLHLAGLRELTSVLNGTVGSVVLGWKLSGVLAAIYIIFYLASVVLVPIMLLAAFFLTIWQKHLPQAKTTALNAKFGEMPAKSFNTTER